MESPVYSVQQINGAPLRSGLRQIASQLHHLSDVGCKGFKVNRSGNGEI